MLLLKFVSSCCRFFVKSVSACSPNCIHISVFLFPVTHKYKFFNSHPSVIIHFLKLSRLVTQKVKEFTALWLIQWVCFVLFFFWYPVIQTFRRKCKNVVFWEFFQKAQPYQQQEQQPKNVAATKSNSSHSDSQNKDGAKQNVILGKDEFDSDPEDDPFFDDIPATGGRFNTLSRWEVKLVWLVSGFLFVAFSSHFFFHINFVL